MKKKIILDVLSETFGLLLPVKLGFLPILEKLLMLFFTIRLSDVAGTL
jgi:hypothetical protein